VARGLRLSPPGAPSVSGRTVDGERVLKRGKSGNAAAAGITARGGRMVVPHVRRVVAAAAAAALLLLCESAGEEARWTKWLVNEEDNSPFSPL